MARNGAIKGRTAAANQLHSLCDTAPDAIRAQLRGFIDPQEGRNCRAVAARVEHERHRVLEAGAARGRTPVDTEIRDLDRHITAVLDKVAPVLLVKHGVG